MSLRDWYRHPRYYEAVFAPDTERELDFLETVNRAWGTGGKSWLEPACGAGRLVQGAVRRGYRVVGYDVSEEMLDYARGRLKPAERRRVHLSRDRMEAFRPRRWLGKLDLGFNLVSTFRYLDSDEAALAHLKTTRALLKPGGIYVLGFHITDYARRTPEHERWVERVEDETVVCNTREWPPDRRRRRSRMRNRLRVHGPRGDFTIDTDWYFRTWNEREIARVIDAAGFEACAVYTFDLAFDAPIGWDSDRLDRVLVLQNPR